MANVVAGGARKRAVALILFAAAVTGCGTAVVTPYPAAPSVAAGDTGSGPGTSVVASMSKDDALLTYGYAPSPSPSVKFQPDVVMVGGGSASIRWASEDGHTWAIDPADLEASSE
jgi:hypothetical protein